MKLVELLARELVEWPDGCFEAHQSGIDLEVYLDGADEVFFASEAADDRGLDNFGVTREMWEAELARLASTAEWNGEGLPPVGTVCEGLEYANWVKVEVIAHYEGRAVCMLPCKERVAIADPDQLRPVIRAPEQIAAQEREDGIAAMCKLVFYRQDYSVQQETGTSTKDYVLDACRHLYDKGYRKQEQSE